MDGISHNKTPVQPKNLMQLLPCIKDIITKDSALFLAKRQVCYSTNKTSNNTVTTEKKIRPLTIAELRALTGPSQKFPPPTTSTKKKPWNSSVKVDKTKSRTADDQLKHSTVRKVLNFQPKPRPTSVPSNRMVTKIPSKPKKSTHDQGKTNVMNRISGINKIPETPVLNKLPAFRVPNIKVANTSMKSNSDISFLEREKEINEFEEKCTALTEEPTLEKIDEVSPPISTPFKEYRNVRDYFSKTCDDDNSILYKNNSTSLFEKSGPKDESVLVSLCDMLCKATVSNADINNREQSDMQKLQIETQNNIIMLDNVIGILTSMKEKQVETLSYINKLTQVQVNKQQDYSNGHLAPHKTDAVTVKEENNQDNSPLIRDTVIKKKSPSYKIPRKSTCLRKKAFHKSLPNALNDMQTPIKNNDKALDMYLQIKQQMTFLNTPLTKRSRAETPDTPAITSHNLQRQLDKLYNED